MQDKYGAVTFKKDFFIEHYKMGLRNNMENEHYHDFYEIFLNLGDEMEYFINSKTFYLKKLDLVFIDKFIYHRTFYKSKGAKERILIYFQDGILNLIQDRHAREKVLALFHNGKLSFGEEFSQHVSEVLVSRVLSQYYRKESATGLLRAKLIFADLLLEMVERFAEGIIVEDESTAFPHQKRVSKIAGYINSNYYKYITLDSLCKHFYINKYYLCHIFKQVTGTSVIDFINKKRLAEAERMLKYSQYNITQISEKVGFSSSNYFISLFRKAYNVTPKAFRDSINTIAKS